MVESCVQVGGGWRGRGGRRVRGEAVGLGGGVGGRGGVWTLKIHMQTLRHTQTPLLCILNICSLVGLVCISYFMLEYSAHSPQGLL